MIQETDKQQEILESKIDSDLVFYYGNMCPSIQDRSLSAQGDLQEIASTQ